MEEITNLSVRAIRTLETPRDLTDGSKWEILGYADITMEVEIKSGIKARAMQTDYRIVRDKDSGRISVFSPIRRIGENRIIQTGGGELQRGSSDFTIEGLLFDAAVKSIVKKAYLKSSQTPKPVVQPTTQAAQTEIPFSE